MFTNNINPVIIRLGFLEIRYYGIIYALGFIISYLFLRYFIKHGRIKGMNLKKLDDLILYLVIGVVSGARLFNFIFYDISVFWTNPLEILRIWHGGLSFHGGLIGAITAVILFSKKYKIRIMGLMDSLVIPASLSLALGRIANFTNQELYGTISNLPWCVKFSAVDNLCRHPYQIYASISHFIMFAILLFIYKKQKEEGTALWSFILIYGGFRIFTDIFREEVKFLGIISMGQTLSLIMFMTAWVVLIRRMKKNKEKEKQKT